VSGGQAASTRSSRGSATRKRVVELLTSALTRVARRGPIVVPEYDLHPKARYGWDGQAPLGSLSKQLDAWTDEHLDDIVDVLSSLCDWAGSVPRTSAVGPCWENDYWGSIDALWQVAALRDRTPARYVEVGSGFSTLFARRAIDDFGLRTRITSIDPSPRREIDEVCDEVIRDSFELTSLSVFDDLTSGDVVLIDGSHVVSMNSDATVFFLEVLPSLPPGVLVGIDDIYLPWDYHPSWVSRGYGEQYLLAAYLLGGAGGDAIDLPGWVVARALAEDKRLSDLWPIIENRFGRLASSFWLERMPAASGPV
jgi:hypothetical protein